MDIHHLHIFSAVFRWKSFTKAAQQINISQPTVSEHIKNLENELGCRLFDRIGKVIEPTASAQALFPKALKIIEELAQLKKDLQGGENETKGEIILGASTIPGTYLLPPIIKRFKKNYPDIFFQIIIEDSGRINQMVLDNDLACGIVGAQLNKNALHYELFCKDQLSLVASPKLFKKKTITLEELCKLPFILRESGSGTGKAMEENFKRLGIKLERKQVAAEFSTTASVKEAAKHGLGLAILSHLAIEEELEQGTLQEISYKKELMERTFHMVTHKKRTLPNPLKRFCQFLLENPPTPRDPIN